MSRKTSRIPWPTLERPLPFAHRGGAGLWPENTLFAFANAARLGCGVMELDVHLTKDEVLVVCHDATVDRTTNGSGAIRELSLAELHTLDAAHHFQLGQTGFYPLRGKGLTIPSLEQLVVAQPQGRFNIDIKGEGPVAETLLKFIIQHGLSERVLVVSESYRKINHFRSLAGNEIATSASRREVVAFRLAVGSGLTRMLKPQYCALQVPLRVGPLTLVDARFVKAARALGVEVHVWTVNTRHEIEHALGCGVSGVMSDYPDLLVDCLYSTGSNSVSRLDDPS